MVSALKDPLTLNDLMATPIYFSKYVLNGLKIENLTQGILLGPTFNLLKGTCSSSIELEYNFQECFNALTYKLDWNNPEGDRYPFDLSKPLPLQGPLGCPTVVANYFFNNDVEYLKTFDPEVRKFSKHNVYSTKAILGVKSVSVKKLHGYDMLLLTVQHKLFHLNVSDIVDLLWPFNIRVTKVFTMTMKILPGTTSNKLCGSIWSSFGDIGPECLRLGDIKLLLDWRASSKLREATYLQYLTAKEDQVSEEESLRSELKPRRRKKEVLKMAPKRTSTFAAPAMNQAAIQQLIDNHVTVALEAQAANMANTNNTNRNPKPKETPATRKLFSCSNSTKDCKVKFAIGTLTEDALSWWNSYAKPIGIKQANKITWSELKRLLTNKYCPRTEVKKMEDEFYNLVVKGNDLKTYARKFQEFGTKH
nr:reverse transcriptase domain-containing protein [Tanacetum cinerariifolium]